SLKQRLFKLKLQLRSVGRVLKLKPLGGIRWHRQICVSGVESDARDTTGRHRLQQTGLKDRLVAVREGTKALSRLVRGRPSHAGFPADIEFGQGGFNIGAGQGGVQCQDTDRTYGAGGTSPLCD